jgi:hypothetical protein
MGNLVIGATGKSLVLIVMSISCNKLINRFLVMHTAPSSKLISTPTPFSTTLRARKDMLVAARADLGSYICLVWCAWTYILFETTRPAEPCTCVQTRG